METLNALLVRELTLADAYARDMAPLRGRTLALAAQLRGQALAHVDALNKAIRGLGGEAEAEAEEVEAAPPRDRREALTLLYEGENVALAEVMAAAAQLESVSARTLATALAASRAQHLVVLRQGLGSGLAGSVPAPLESGEEPPPTPAEGG